MTSDSRPKAHVRPTGTSFVGLVGVELRRLWWRRLTKVVILAVVVLVGVTTYAAYQQSSPENIAQRLDDYNAMVAEQKRHIDSMPPEEKAAQLEACRRDEASARENDPNASFQCDRMFELPSLESFGIVNTARDALMVGQAQGGVYFFGFLAFLLGASFIAAEFGTGSMGNWLTFQPRRLRVGAAKLLAALGGGLGIGALGVGLAALGATLVTTVNRPDSTLRIPDPPATDDAVVETLLRVVAIVALAGFGGAVIGLIVRSTAGVIGLVLGWSIVAEGIIASSFDGGRLQPWFMRVNIEAFVERDAAYFVTICGPDGCQGSQLVNTYTHSWVYLLVVAVVGAVVALALFKRRDVT
jgi:ABC-2 type transport system permease protein